jgi:hypothetical protein
MDAFKYVLRKLSPPVATGDTWDSVRRNAGGPEFDALDEASRVAVFDKFMKRMMVF